MAAWADPTQDLDKAFGETTARYLRAAYQPRPFAAVGRWTYPVQLQSYFIADLIASQTQAYLRSQFAPLYGKPDAMEHIRKHYLAPGNSIPWQEKIRPAKPRQGILPWMSKSCWRCLVGYLPNWFQGILPWMWKSCLTISSPTSRM